MKFLSAFILFSFVVSTYAKDSDLQTNITIPWLTSQEMQKLNPEQREQVLNSMGTTCKAVYSDKVCKKKSKSWKTSVLKLAEKPQQWSKQSKFFQSKCEKGNDRSNCYGVYQGLQDTRQEAGLESAKPKAPEERVVATNNLNLNSNVSEDDDQAAQRTKCRTNLLIEGLRCQRSDKMDALVSVRDTQDYFCSSKSTSSTWGTDTREKLARYLKCLEANSKKAPPAERSWFRAAIRRINLDLKPNLTVCLSELQKSTKFNRKKIGNIQFKPDVVTIHTPTENITTQKSYIGATLDSRGHSLCQYQLLPDVATTTSSTGQTAK